MSTRTYTYTPHAIDTLRSFDLRDESAQWDGDQHAYRITIDGEAEAAEALAIRDTGRIGIAWGSDATWASYDADEIEDAIDDWLNNPDEWESRN